MIHVRIYVSVLLSAVFFQLTVRAQSVQDKICVELNPTADSVFLDSLSLVPESLQIRLNGREISPDTYSYDYSSGYLHLHTSHNAEDQLQACYRRLAFSFNTRFQHKSLDRYDSTALFDTVSPTGTAIGAREELFKTPQLQKSGSISRGLSVGNRQDVFVNSSLNLQLEGQLANDLNIRAAITDQNIPVQPDGHTQQLQDFDNVFIELFNDDFSLTAGDVVLQQAAGRRGNSGRNGNDLSLPEEGPYFLRYRRNVQGALLKTVQSIGKAGQADFSAGFALAEGRFSALRLQVQEGVLGPYQLKAAENEHLSGQPLRSAFYIIANSEKVYLDGKLLQRGFDRDYVIDYNLAEITFTSRVLITRYSRVNIELEFADRSYSRSVFTASARHHLKASSIYAHYYRERDNPRQALGFQLSDDDKLQLSLAGDRPEAAFVSTARQAEEQPSGPTYQTNRRADVPGIGNLYRVFYNRKDTVVNGAAYQVYEYAGQEGAYRVDFNYVGEGQGDYVLSGAAVNTKVYEWVAPLNGQSRGNYAPLRPLQAPAGLQVLTLGVESKLSRHDRIRSEVAVSENDLNLLSEADRSDDRGRAFLLLYESADRKLGESGYYWKAQSAYEYRHRHFREVDPYRSIEFERDWTLLPVLLNDSSRHDDHLLTASLSARKEDQLLSYQWSGRRQAGLMRGMQHRARLERSLGGLRLEADAFMLRSDQQDKHSRWRRLTADVHWPGRKLVPGYRFTLDKNSISDADTDSVFLSLMNFEEHQLYLRTPDSLNQRFRMAYSRRKDFAPYEGSLIHNDLAHTVSVEGNFDFSDKQRLSLLAAYRSLLPQNDSLPGLSGEPGSRQAINSLMGQLNWNTSMFSDALRSELHYSLANGREPRREFVYVQVPVGEGAYTWRDDNQNGIEELDEFYEARYPDERNYIRVFMPTTDFVLAYSNQLNWQLRLQAPRAWKQSQGLRQFLSRFASVNSWQFSKRVSSQSLADRLLPALPRRKEDLLSLKERLRSTLYFNRGHTVYGANLSMRRSRRRQLLSTGYEERNTEAAQLAVRWNISRHWGVSAQQERGSEQQKLSLGNTGNRRDFDIVYQRWQPGLNWQPNMNTRLALSYTYLGKESSGQPAADWSPESSTQHVLGLDIRLSKMMSHTISAGIEVVEISYNGREDSALAYEMLDGLAGGSNARWTLNWQQRLLDGLQLMLNYHGRKSADNPALHTGSIMMRAMF